MTRREKVLNILRDNRELSCNEMVIELLDAGEKEFGEYANKAAYRYIVNNMNASLSGTLNRMVKKGELELSTNKGPKGGKKYKLKN